MLVDEESTDPEVREAIQKCSMEMTEKIISDSLAQGTDLTRTFSKFRKIILTLQRKNDYFSVLAVKRYFNHKNNLSVEILIMRNSCRFKNFEALTKILNREFSEK